MFIRTVNVNKEFIVGNTKVQALMNINCNFEMGKFYALVGRSGSGKSTLLHLLGGLDAPSSGEIIVDNHDIVQFNDNEKAKYRNSLVGFVFQAFHLEHNYTCLDNVILPLIPGGYPRNKRKDIGIEVLDKLGLKERIYHKPKELSGGEKQRVAIARALINNPSIILADEPTGNLDSNSGQNVISILRKMADEGKMVILVTHNLVDASVADTIIELNDGMIIKRDDR